MLEERIIWFITICVVAWHEIDLQIWRLCVLNGISFAENIETT